MKRNKRKVIVIVLVVAALLAATGAGVWYAVKNRNKEPVTVLPFMNVGMTEYWGDSQESYGPVTTDRIQTVFVSGTQTVTELLVQEGDTVKKGDILMRFDTTLSELALERERLGVEKLKLQLENAKKELKDIKNMKPMVIPTPSPDPEPEENLGVMIPGDYQISQNKAYDGSSLDKSLILWIGDSVNLRDDILEAVRVKAEEYQRANAPAPTEPEPAEEPATEPAEEPATKPAEEPATEPAEEPATEPAEEPATEPAEEPATEPTEEINVNRFFLVVKVTDGNMSLGRACVWQGLEVTKNQNGGFSIRFLDASAVKDHSLPQQDTPAATEPDVDYGSGFTSAQIAQMRSEKEKEIRDLEFQIKMAEAEYAIKQTEMETGEVIANIDGTVVALLDEEEARLTGQPILKVSGGGGFYMQGAVSELEKDNLQIGQEVTVNDWNTGMTYTGTIQSVGDFPTSNGYWSGVGNPNVSYYPFTVFIDESADLQEGSYVNVSFSTATTQQGIYLENPFLRTEQGKSYVYVRGEDGKLEQRFVTTGKALWGSYTEVLDGLTPEDYIAFPYGKNVVVGADTVEGDNSDLYG